MKTRRDWLKWVAAGFALIATASAEYEIARAIGMNQWIAAAVPGALDAYVVRALRAHREVLTAVLAMVGVNAASHLVTAGVLPVGWPLITAVSAIAPLVLWRVHALSTPGEARLDKIWDVPARPAFFPSTEPDTVNVPASVSEGPSTREFIRQEYGKDTCDNCGHVEHGDSMCLGVDLRTHGPCPCADELAELMGTPTGAVSDGSGGPSEEPAVGVPAHEPTPFDLLADASTRPDRDVPGKVLTLSVPAEREGVRWDDVDDVAAHTKARDWCDQHGGMPSLRTIKDVSKVGTDRARRVLNTMKSEEHDG